MGKQAWCQRKIAGWTHGSKRTGKAAAVLSALLACVLTLGLSGGSSAADSAEIAEESLTATQYSGFVAKPGRIASDLIAAADVDALAAEVDSLARQKQELESRFSIEYGRHESALLRIKESKKTIRVELDEILQSGSSRSRLDGMLARHEELIEDDKKLAQVLAKTQEELASQQLELVQKRRDLERLEARYAAQQREQALAKVQEVTRQLERNLGFRETVTFKCSTSKSLGSCLGEYPLEARIQTWIGEHYQKELSRDLEKTTGPVRLSSDWYTTTFSRDFVEASMSLQGTVTADVDVRAQVRPRKMMACAMLGAPAELCETQSVSLIVRSNKYGDQVLVNKKPYGSTPLSLMLDPGVYNIEVRYQGLTQKRTLTLDENRHINFVF